MKVIKIIAVFSLVLGLNSCSNNNVSNKHKIEYIEHYDSLINKPNDTIIIHKPIQH